MRCSRVIVPHALLARALQVLAQRRALVLAPEAPATLQLGYDKLDGGAQGRRRDGIGDVEASMSASSIQRSRETIGGGR